jgi:hypothetical protein
MMPTPTRAPATASGGSFARFGGFTPLNRWRMLRAGADEG